MIKLYKENRVFRTFIQSFVAYILTNATLAINAMNAQNWWKILLTTLLIPAVATGVSAITKDNYEGGGENDT